MFKTEEQINERLNSKNNLVNRFGGNSISPGAPAPAPVESHVEVIPLEQPGNKEGNKKLSIETRNDIAVRARAGENQTSLAKEYRVSQSAIGEIEQGNTKVDEISVQARLDQVQDVALQKLLGSLGYLTPEKLEKAKAGELSIIASNMSKVVGNIRQKSDIGPQVNIQIYAPELKNESSYKVVDV